MGRRQVKDNFKPLRQLRHALCMCAIQRVNGQDKIFKCLWTGYGVGARCTGLFQELQRCCFFHAQQFPVCIKNGPPPKEHPANLTKLWEALQSTWANIPVERFWHLVESLPWVIDAVLRAKGGVQLNIRKVFLMFCKLSVIWPCHQKICHCKQLCSLGKWCRSA